MQSYSIHVFRARVYTAAAYVVDGIKLPIFGSQDGPSQPQYISPMLLF